MRHLAGLLHEEIRVGRIEVAWASEHWEMAVPPCTLWIEYGNVGLHESRM